MNEENWNRLVGNHAELVEAFKEWREMYMDDLKVTHRLLIALCRRVEKLDGITDDEMIDEVMKEIDDE